MLTLPLTLADKHNIKKFADKKSHYFISDFNGDSYLFCHGDEEGKLTIPDEDLKDIYFLLDKIVCCYPRRVIPKYQDTYPDIGNKILHPYADCVTSYVVDGNTVHIFDYKMSMTEYLSIRSSLDIIVGG